VLGSPPSKARFWACGSGRLLSGVVYGAGCQRGALGFGVGVVDPGAKRRFWD
jgi:hypothetical protein